LKEKEKEMGHKGSKHKQKVIGGEESGLTKLKLVEIGDGGTGKTCFMKRHVNFEFPQGYVPTTMDDYTQPKFEWGRGNPNGLSEEDEGKTVELVMWDTYTSEDYPRLRVLMYPQTDIFLVFFSVMGPCSFLNTERVWVPEIRHHMPQTPFILVATKVDLRDDAEALKRLAIRGEEPIDSDTGLEKAKELGAVGYVECSAKTGLNVHEIVERATYLVMKGDRNFFTIFAERGINVKKAR